MDTLIRIAGEAGQGAQTTGELLVDTFAATGLHLAATKSYMSRIRGGLNWFDIRIGEAPLWGGRERADLLIALSEPGLKVLRERQADGALTILDAGESADGAAAIPFTRTAKEVGETAVMANVVAAGAVLTTLGNDVEALKNACGSSSPGRASRPSRRTSPVPGRARNWPRSIGAA